MQYVRTFLCFILCLTHTTQTTHTTQMHAHSTAMRTRTARNAGEREVTGVLSEWQRGMVWRTWDRQKKQKPKHTLQTMLDSLGSCSTATVQSAATSVANPVAPTPTTLTSSECLHCVLRNTAPGGEGKWEEDLVCE